MDVGTRANGNQPIAWLLGIVFVFCLVPVGPPNGYLQALHHAHQNDYGLFFQGPDLHLKFDYIAWKTISIIQMRSSNLWLCLSSFCLEIEFCICISYKFVPNRSLSMMIWWGW